MSYELHDLGCRLGMDPYGEITADAIFQHVMWLEQRAREQERARLTKKAEERSPGDLG